MGTEECSPEIRSSSDGNDSLYKSSQGWHEGAHGLLPWTEYFLGVMLLTAYREFEKRVGVLTMGRGAKAGMILNAIRDIKGEFTVRIRELLIGSHILPWRSHPGERLNVRNGICLSRLHDAAFDRGLISFDDKLRLLLSPRLKQELPQRAVADNFAAYEGQPLALPEDAALPDLSFLASHRADVFCKVARPY
jgi:hypothetical protein